MALQNLIGLRVQAFRKARGLTQEALAEAAGRSVDTLSLIERGRILPSIDTLVAVADGLGLSLAELIPDTAGRELPLEVVRLREAAGAALGRMDIETLTVAVTQLDALVGLNRP